MKKMPNHKCPAIEKGIPLPARYDRNAWPFSQMEIGDSFLAGGMKMSEFSGTVGTYARREHKKFACRTVPGGVRVWRIA